MSGKVLVFGSINTDLVTYVENLPEPGETVTGGKFISFPGGKGANQAVAAAYAGAQVELFGCIGDDSLGKERLISLENSGVSTQNITVKTGIHTGIAQIIVDKKGENIISVAPGANNMFGLDDIDFPEYPAKELIISLFQNEIPQSSTEAIIQECQDRKMKVLWNTAPACKQKPLKETLEAVDFLICNQHELTLLAQSNDYKTGAHILQGWGVKNLIVTLGERGSLLITEQDEYHQPAFPVNVIDTVGTGDCFCGFFAHSLSIGRSVKDSLRRASAAASLSATVRGALTSMPTADQVNRFLSANRDIS